jgi:hypothetical protein
MFQRPVVFIITTLLIWGAIVGFTFYGTSLYDARVPDCENSTANVTQFIIGNYTPFLAVNWINVTFTYSVNDSIYSHDEWVSQANEHDIEYYKSIYYPVGRNIPIGYLPSNASFSWSGGCPTYWGYTVLIDVLSFFAFILWLGFLVCFISDRNRRRRGELIR